jgi:hypothetical protein
MLITGIKPCFPSWCKFYGQSVIEWKPRQYERESLIAIVSGMQNPFLGRQIQANAD